MRAFELHRAFIIILPTELGKAVSRTELPVIGTFINSAWLSVLLVQEFSLGIESSRASRLQALLPKTRTSLRMHPGSKTHAKRPCQDFACMALWRELRIDHGQKAVRYTTQRFSGYTLSL